MADSVGRVADSIGCVAENSMLEHRSRVRGSVVGSFSHVAFLLSCAVSSEFKQLHSSATTSGTQLHQTLSWGKG